MLPGFVSANTVAVAAIDNTIAAAINIAKIRFFISLLPPCGFWF
jgi:hypothetical protein